jgi:pyruvate/2-oxoglutarate dehydrogenase complex dihydrolipoamide acyltransferase (E2) component
MPTHSLHRALVATLLGAVFVAAAQAGHAASQEPTAPAESAQQVALQKPRAEPAARRAAEPLALQLEDAGGNPVRLVHVPSVGWQYDKTVHGADSALRKTALQTAGAPPAAGGSDDDLPLTVFIDGPSGFTYVWNRSDGWKYIGRLGDDSL